MTSRLFPAVFLLAAYAGLPSAYAKDPVPTAQQLIDAAHQQAELSVIAPYVLTGTVVVNPGQKTEQTGQLTIYRDHDRSRVELQFGAYNEISMSLGDRKYISRGKHDLTAMGLIDLDENWDPGLPPSNSSKPAYKFGRVKKATIDGHNAWCFDEKWPSGKERLCFDAERSLLVSEDFGSERHRKYLDYASGAQPALPRLVQVREKGMLSLEVRDISVSRESLDEKLFTEPPDTIEIETCKDMRPPEPVSTPEPIFPRDGNYSHETVQLSVIIARDGRVAEVQALNHANDAYAESAKHAVVQWTFKPATCSGQPVNMEMRLDIDFNLH